MMSANSNERSDKKTNPFVYTLMYGVIVIIAAQLNFKLFTEGFVISAGVIVFSLLMLLLEEFATLPVIFLSAAGVMVTNAIQTTGHIPGSQELWDIGMPSFAYYMTYGIVVYLLFQTGRRKKSIPVIFGLLLIPDFTANTIELMIRQGGRITDQSALLTLVIVAIARSAIVVFAYMVISRYGLAVTKMPRSGMEIVDGVAARAETHDDHRNPEIEEIALQAKSVYHRLKSAGAPEELVAKAEALVDTIERYQAD